MAGWQLFLAESVCCTMLTMGRGRFLIKNRKKMQVSINCVYAKSGGCLVFLPFHMFAKTWMWFLFSLLSLHTVLRDDLDTLFYACCWIYPVNRLQDILGFLLWWGWVG